MNWLMWGCALLLIYIYLDDLTTDRVAKWVAFVFIVLGTLFISCLANMH